MDTATQAALSVAHQNLSDDLAKVSQLIEPVNDRALAMLYHVQRRLQDIQELAKGCPGGDRGAARTTPEAPEPPRMRLSDINPLLHSGVDDTLAHVADVLNVLAEINPDDGIPEGFRGGMNDLLFLLNRTLWVHINHGHELPNDVVLEQADWQRALPGRAQS